MADAATHQRATRFLGGAAAAAGLGAIAASGLGAEAWPLLLGLVACALLCAATISHDRRLGVGVTALAGVAANAYLFSRKLSASGDAFCNVNDVINCDVVNSSPWSEVAGLPITLFGIAFYTGLALAALLAPDKGRLAQVTGLFSIVNVPWSIFLAWLSYDMGHLCVVCTLLYAVSFLLAWAAVAGLNDQGTRLLDDPIGALTSRPMGIVAATFVAVVLVGSSAWRARPAAPIAAPGGEMTQNDLERLLMEPAGPVALEGDEPVLGDPNAPYLVVEFADFGCPHCAHAEREFHELVQELPQVQVRFRVFPLSGACNPVLQSQDGVERCIAAIGAQCATEQGKFWPYAASVFKNQAYLQPEDLRFQAEQVGLEMARWTECISRPETAAQVRADAQAGADAGVQGTPSVYLKGTHGERFVLVRGPAGPVVAVRKLVEAHLAGKPMPTPPPYSFEM